MHLRTALTCLKVLSLTSLAGIPLCGAEAYESRTAYETEHFAIYEVILEEHESWDAELALTLSHDFKGQSALERRYQTTTAIFPHGSKGLRGTVGEKMLGTLTYAAYGQKNGEIAFDRTANTASKAGLYLSFDMLTAFVDNKALNNLIPELAALPLVVKGIPVTLSGHDYAKARYVTAATKALLLDTRVIDSAYYPLERLDGLNEKCTVDLLFIIDRLIPGIPLFISAHGTLNGIDCAEEESLSGEMSAEAQ